MDLSDIISLAKNIDKQIDTSDSKPSDKKRKKKKKRSRNSTDEDSSSSALTKRPRSSQHTVFDDKDDDNVDDSKSVSTEVVDYPYEVNPDDHCETKADG
jgi:hypothetical protein